MHYVDGGQKKKKKIGNSAICCIVFGSTAKLVADEERTDCALHGVQLFVSNARGTLCGSRYSHEDDRKT